MSTYTKIKAIEYELDIINRQIDMKIITGRPYKRDALRHKSLLAELRQLKSKNESNWFSRLGHTFATMMF